MTNEERVLASNEEVAKIINSVLKPYTTLEQQNTISLAAINNNLANISLSLAIIADILSKTSDSSDDAKEPQ